jgi:hypothetical protein
MHEDMRPGAPGGLRAVRAERVRALLTLYFTISRQLLSSPSKLLQTYSNADSASMKKITGYIDKLTNSISDSPTQIRAHHQISPPYPSTALPSFPTTRHGSSTSRYLCSKGPLIGHARLWIRKNITNLRRCMSFARLHVMTG